MISAIFPFDLCTLSCPGGPPGPPVSPGGPPPLCGPPAAPDGAAPSTGASFPAPEPDDCPSNVSESRDVVCGGTYCASAGMYVGSYLTNEVSVALGPASFSAAKSSADAS